ncbi:pyridoxine 5'-phosphate synthase [bacterium]|nr:pyridoxine 5'-phosphate synthase [bacterium]
MELCVNIDHVATLRNARGTPYPEPVVAAAMVELAGAHGITVHPREDGRHIRPDDVRRIRPMTAGRFTLEMANTPANRALALEVKPDLVTLVPEKRQELTTEGGLDAARQVGAVRELVSALADAGIPTSLFIDPQRAQIEAAVAAGAAFVEFHTGRYADATTESARAAELEAIRRAVGEARAAGLRTNAGHGLHLHTTRPIARIEGIEQLHIGHGIIARAVFVGLERAVRKS